MMNLRKFSAIVLGLAIAYQIGESKSFASESSRNCRCNEFRRLELMHTGSFLLAAPTARGRQITKTVAGIILRGEVRVVDVMCSSAKSEPSTRVAVAAGLAVAHVELGRAGGSIVIFNQRAVDTARSIFNSVTACGDDKFIQAFRERIVEERYRGDWGKDKGGACKGPPCSAG